MTTVAVVTGASSGMGRACVEVLRDTADHLVAVDLSVPDIDGTIGMACDIADRAAVGQLVGQVRGLGSLRSLVHAAGISPSMGDARRVFEVDLVGTHHVVSEFEALVERGTAAVCFSSSAAYQIAPFADPAHDRFLDVPGASEFLDEITALISDSGHAYALAKRGVVRLVGRASVRWGSLGGRINSLAPGLIDTPMGQLELSKQPMMRDMLSRTPLGRLGDPREIASAVRYLLSDEASFVCGIDLLVDGGMLQGQ